MSSDRDKVLGDYAGEMKRRREDARVNRKKDASQLLPALALVVFGVWPLGFWHAAALVGGLVWMFCVSDEVTFRLADDVDLLEEKLVAQLAQMK
jgi:hypothetical protein